MDNNIRPAPTSRISPSTPGDEKNSADSRPGKVLKPTSAAKKSPAPPEIESPERDEKHQLDERA